MPFKNVKEDNDPIIRMLEGGKVPGKSPSAGDSPKNDIVPAKLSPGEIVIKRSKAADPEAAAKEAKKISTKALAEGGTSSPTDTATETGGSSPGGASTGGVGSGIGGAGTGGAATGGASTGGAGTVTLTISGDSGGGKKGKGAKAPTTINISHIGGNTEAGNVASGDGPGSSGIGGSGKGHGGGGGGASPDEPTGFSEGGEVKKPSDNGTLVGFRELLRKVAQQKALENEPYALTGSTETAKAPNMAAGGFPPLNDAMTSLNQTPPTNYDFYKDISAEDRAKLYQQLNQQQHGAGQAAISGLAGIGDAISNSFGGQHNQFQKGVQEQSTNNMNQQLGAMDTQRSQRMQDMQGNQEMQMNDPRHPLANTMREMLKSQGVNVPSGMPVNLMVKVLGPMGDFALKKASQDIQMAGQAENVRHNRVEEGNQAGNAALAGQKEAQDVIDKANARKDAANTTLSHQGPLQRFTNMIPLTRSAENQQLRDTANGDQPKTGGWKYLGKK